MNGERVVCVCVCAREYNVLAVRDDEFSCEELAHTAHTRTHRECACAKRLTHSVSVFAVSCACVVWCFVLAGLFVQHDLKGLTNPARILCGCFAISLPDL